jgi:cell division transport system permease protein
MVNFLRYAIRETATNLWRNRLMTMAAVLTVTVSLGLVGSALYLKQGAAQASASWERQTEVIVYMSATSTTSEHNAVKSQLSQSPYVVQPCVFRSKRWDYEEALRLLPPGEVATLTPKSTPSSFRCTPAQPADAALVFNQFSGAPGVFTVFTPQAEIHAIQTTVNWLQIALLVIALVLMMSASVLILNSIRMAIFARRREVSVMKLVGATNWFIRIPFIAEGMIQGLMGAVLASAWVYGIHVVVDDISDPNNPQSLGAQMRLTGWHVFVTDLVVVLIGALIGSIGSAFAVRRFLDV